MKSLPTTLNLNRSLFTSGQVSIDDLFDRPTVLSHVSDVTVVFFAAAQSFYLVVISISYKLFDSKDSR